MALSYLLPIVLIAVIIEYCAINLSFRIIGKGDLSFLITNMLITIVSTVIVYGIVLKVVDKAYFANGWRRAIHFVGYVTAIPILLYVLSTAIFIVPVGIHVYRVISPTIEGEAKIKTGE